MELRELACRILDVPTLQARLEPVPEELTDDDPGPARPWRAPARPPSLQIAPKPARKSIPHPDALHDPAMRARCLHIFANHELMALELMAWAILAYPQAPAAFRRGLGWLIAEEQRHLRLYIERLEALGVRFGDVPVNDHFWRLAPQLTTPLEWVCAMNLTFEQANLDHAPAFAEHFRRFDDHDSAALMDRITDDEIKHVGFGARWLAHFAGPEADLYEVFASQLTAYNSLDRARGPAFNAEARRQAGLDEVFITRLGQL